VSQPLFQGERIRLAAEDSKLAAEWYARWSRDAEYLRLLDAIPAQPRLASQLREWIERDADKADFFPFTILAAPESRLIGFVNLEAINWTHGNAWLGIGLGDRDYWSQGYGTDAVRVILRYAFSELNLHRVTLDVFEYNTRALRCYEKAGFVVEGRECEYIHRDGRRWDMIHMGILREEWERDWTDQARPGRSECKDRSFRANGSA
jgi:RimJ/RimL family protein N-acetyltransferase